MPSGQARLDRIYPIRLPENRLTIYIGHLATAATWKDTIPLPHWSDGQFGRALSPL